MSDVGMDAEAVRSTAAQLDHAAASLTSIATMIDGLVAHLASEWKGGDADQFAGWWRSQHRPALMRCSSAVAGLAHAARNNAAEQDTTSAASSGLGGSTGGQSSGSSTFSPVDGLVLGGLLASMPGSAGIGAGLVIHNGQTMLNEADDGLGDSAVDGMGFIPVVGRYAGFTADGTGLLQDLATGQPVLPDVKALGWDAAGLYPPIGAYKFGTDIGRAISNIPAVHDQLDSYDNWVVANGASSGGDIGTRYDGVGGFINFVEDGTGLSRLF